VGDWRCLKVLLLTQLDDQKAMLGTCWRRMNEPGYNKSSMTKLYRKIKD
jgi:hypothetical protein